MGLVLTLGMGLVVMIRLNQNMICVIIPIILVK